MTLKDPDRHELPGVLTRVTPEARDKAKEVLAKHGWTMSDFLAACINLVPLNPGAMLERLAPYRPTKRRGRPKKAPNKQSRARTPPS